ncbi:hypothetical protein [Agarivorans sp. 1_MG-2023]|uniref:hypothetical protein n=1 Tax=Agarivorans sp. 1_MG-2023 TaxID=3062634 RepID=UPI0026E2EEB4|nr:hypothetical protein [Agarivorans sp. 1_MG-2023]MDO6762680.1 hypothetical protein [Agarivorans sp. 1_MG-2023]
MSVSMSIRVLVLLALSSMFVANVALAAHQSRTVIYQIEVEGDVVGSYQLTRMVNDLQPTAMTIQEQVNLDFSFLWFNEQYQRNGKVMLEGGKLKHFAYKVSDEEAQYLIFGSDKLEQGLHINAVEHKAEQNPTRVKQLAKSIDRKGADSGIPLALSAFSDAPDAIVQQIDFDTDSASLADHLVTSIDHKNTHTLKVLDLDEFDIISYQVKYLGEKPLSAAKRVYVSHGFELANNTSNTEIWVSKDKLGAFIVEQSGVNDGDSFKVNMQQYLF